jgi:hypothetical protein
MTFADSESSEARAAAILADHQRGLHDEHVQGDRCTWPGCDDAFWLHARAQEHDEEDPWQL